MKLTLFFMAALGLASSGPTVDVVRPSIRSLNDELNDFVALIPTGEVINIVFLYLTTDREIQDIFTYVQSDDFKNLIKALDAIPEYIQFLDYLQNSGLDVYTLVNLLHSILNLNELEVPGHSISLKALKTSRKTGGLNGMLLDIKAILPLDEIEALYKKKLSSSQDFAAFVAKLNSAEFQTIISTLEANEKFQSLLQEAENAGVDLDAVADILSSIFGIRFHNHLPNAPKSR